MDPSPVRKLFKNNNDQFNSHFSSMCNYFTFDGFILNGFPLLTVLHALRDFVWKGSKKKWDENNFATESTLKMLLKVSKYAE